MNDSEIIKTLQRMSRERPDGFGSAILTLIEHRQNNAVREFAEKLKTEIAGLEVKSPNTTYKCGMEDVLYYRMPKIIDRLVEGMTEGKENV